MLVGPVPTALSFRGRVRKHFQEWNLEVWVDFFYFFLFFTSDIQNVIQAGYLTTAENSYLIS